MTSEMFKFSVLLMSLLVVCDRSLGLRSYRSRLQVQNGMFWGTWGQREMCPDGMYAAGFSLKVEEPGGYTFIHCTKHFSGPHKSNVTVESNTGSWGEWSDIKWCSHGFLTSFQLKVEPYQSSWDDTAVNNIRFICSTGNTPEGSGTSWGDWGDWSNKCQGKGICGIKTRVEEPQGIGDDTALNDVHMYCCD
ncbi:LOW QUALITY PROTEIN: vitelline membrane outer layer protein 1 homolog [Misgurnus anguillicaudatus]|uniref:LOW QUALITY PROTEIN: vitelline membrane outer layer protein 1 homolog n=1 Tax=Misgurnus anguillicaudatus TaxID=75329 RepID=UPI003CCF0A20